MQIILRCWKMSLVGIMCTLLVLETNIDWIFSIAMFAVFTMSWTVMNPCCADTMLSIVVWSEALDTTILLCLSLTFSCLARSIFATIHNRKAAIAWWNHSLHCEHLINHVPSSEPNHHKSAEPIRNILLVYDHKSHGNHKEGNCWPFPLNNFLKPRQNIHEWP